MSKRRSISLALSLLLGFLLALPASATFPVVQDSDSATSCQTANSNGWTLTYPTNVGGGNLLLGFMGIDGNPTTTWPAGWSKIAEYANGTASRVVVVRKFATGSESGNFTGQSFRKRARLLARASDYRGTRLDGAGSKFQCDRNVHSARSGRPERGELGRGGHAMVCHGSGGRRQYGCDRIPGELYERIFRPLRGRPGRTPGHGTPE